MKRNVPLCFGPYRIPPDDDLVYQGNAVVTLAPEAVKVLRHLVRHHDRVVSKQELIEEVWRGANTGESAVNKAVAEIRRALNDDPDEARFVQTFHRRGYRFVAPVAVARPESAEDDLAVLPPDFGRLVARDGELAALQTEHRMALDKEGRPVIITGGAGAGKTLLVRHFLRWAAQQGTGVLYGRFSEYPASRLGPYEVFLDMLRDGLVVNATGLTTVTDLRVLARIRCGVNLPADLFVSGLPPRPDVVHAPSRADLLRIIEPIAECIVRLTRFRPHVVVFDDVHWAAESDRELIGYLMRTVGTERLLVVVVAHDDGIGEATEALWGEPHSLAVQRGRRLRLRDWIVEDCRTALLRVFAGDSGAGVEIPESDLLTLHGITGGNPYFVMEMLRLLVSEGAIARGPRGWVYKGLRDIALPDSLAMAASVQVERLAPEVRGLLETGAVIGEGFKVETLASAVGRDPEEVDQALREAVRGGVLSARGLSADEDYRFHHAVVRQVLYESLSTEQRRRIHAAVAQAIERLHGGETERLAPALSSHYERAQDPHRAFAWGLAAWRSARRRSRWPEAVNAIERAEQAAALMSARGPRLSDEERLDLLVALGEAYGATARLRDSEARLKQAIELGHATGRKDAIADAHLVLSTTLVGLGAYLEAESAAGQAAALYQQTGDAARAANARVQWASCRVAIGGYENAVPLLRELLQALDPHSSPAVDAAGLLGWSLALSGRPEEGMPLLERALAGLRRAGDLRRQALLHRRLFFANLSLGHYEAAFDFARRARDGYRRVDDRGGEAKADMEMGHARLAEGLPEEALLFLARTRGCFNTIGDGHCEAEALWLMGRAHVETGESVLGQAELDQALSLVRKVGDRDDEFRILIDIARAHLAAGRPADALRSAEAACAIATELGNEDGRGLALVEVSRAALALGNASRACEEGAAAVAHLERTRSGERWRAFWALGQALMSADPPTAASWFEKAIAQCDAIRSAFGPEDAARGLGSTRAFSPVARDLAMARDRLGIPAEDLRHSWQLGDEEHG